MRKFKIIRKILVLIQVMSMILISSCKSLHEKEKPILTSEFKCEYIENNIRTTEWENFSSFYLQRQLKTDSVTKNNSIKNKISENNRESKSWDLFNSAISILQVNKDRLNAAILFKKVYLEYPDTFYANQSKELSELLTQMIVEDTNWKEPKNINQLTKDEKIKYHIYHLRNISSYQEGNGINWSVFNTDKNVYNAAISLKKIGEPAIPYLINLLNDRRPICTIAYFRDFYPTRTVFRYQDAAIEILNEISKKDFYISECTDCYFSNATCDFREEKWNKIKDWYKRRK